MTHYSHTTKDQKFCLHMKVWKWGRKWIFVNWGIIAIIEVYCKFHCGNHHLQMEQKHITIAVNSGHSLPHQYLRDLFGSPLNLEFVCFYSFSVWESAKNLSLSIAGTLRITLSCSSGVIFYVQFFSVFSKKRKMVTYNGVWCYNKNGQFPRYLF